MYHHSFAQGIATQRVSARRSEAKAARRAAKAKAKARQR
ncbi:hypothetical protein FHU30_000309 [Actinomadura rupiterrae]|nr:hypothetical protein [Actinomadura rupiterrae]